MKSIWIPLKVNKVEVFIVGFIKRFCNVSATYYCKYEAMSIICNVKIEQVVWNNRGKAVHGSNWC